MFPQMWKKKNSYQSESNTCILARIKKKWHCKWTCGCYFHWHCVFTEQQSWCIKIRAKWEFLRPLSKLCWLSFWRRGNLLWRNCPCRNPIRLFSQNSRIHHGFLKKPTALKNKQDCYNFTGNRLTVLLKEQNKAPLNLDLRTLCLWLIVWTEPVSIDKHRCSDLVGWVSSLWEFQTWGLCWEITPVLIIWPWVSWCWTRREDWTLRSTSWRYC